MTTTATKLSPQPPTKPTSKFATETPERELLPGEPRDGELREGEILRPTEAQLEYWERILSQHGLAMEKGDNARVSNSDRRRRVVYVGSDHDLDMIPRHADRRRVRPSGHGPDSETD